MQEFIRVYKPETKVRVSVGWAKEPIHARVRSFSYGPGEAIAYEIVYWDADGERVCIWIDDCEVMCHYDELENPSEKFDIGFHTPDA